jgi:putative ABC transport system substrate-binding protein
MNRRDLITLLGGAAAWPVAARSQQAGVPVVGLLSSVALAPYLLAAVRKGLGEGGYVEGRNVTIEYHTAAGQFDRLPELSAELVRRQVAVILTPGSRLAAEAAKAATASIPIVFSLGANPVQVGLIANLSRPGGKVTGFSEMATELAPKRLEIMHELMPGAALLVLLVDPSAPPPTAVIADLQAAASAIGRHIEVLYVSGTSVDIEAAIADLAQKKVNAVLVSTSARYYDLRAQFAALTARHALPAIYWDRAFPDAGALMSYGSSVEDLFRQVGAYGARILKGEKAGNLPVQQATKFDLVINLKAAKAIGLTIPESFLARADEVIE